MPTEVFLDTQATFNDDRGEDAVKKRHSTVSEAVGVATEMKAHLCLLTHLSQR